MPSGLTDNEKTLIARRARGEYAVDSVVRKIASEHRKNRLPGDKPFLEFAWLISKKNYSWDDYGKLSREVMTIMPHPFGEPWWDKEDIELPKSRRRKVTTKDHRKKPKQKTPVRGLIDLLDEQQ